MKLNWKLIAGVIDVTLLASMRSALVESPDPKPIVLAHYMPWYEAKPASAAWGWHWTMNAYDPDKMVDGQALVCAEALSAS